MATRNLVINDPVGIHARPAAMFAQAVTASGQTVTIAKEGGNAVPAGSILSIMGLGIKQGDTVVIAQAPLAELTDYSTRLRSITRGTGDFTMKPAGYEQVPYDVQAKLVERYEEGRAK